MLWVSSSSSEHHLVVVIMAIIQTVVLTNNRGFLYTYMIRLLAVQNLEVELCKSLAHSELSMCCSLLSMLSCLKLVGSYFSGYTHQLDTK